MDPNQPVPPLPLARRNDPVEGTALKMNIRLLLYAHVYFNDYFYSPFAPMDHTSTHAAGDLTFSIVITEETPMGSRLSANRFVAGKKFEDDEAAELGVFGLVNDAMPPAPEISIWSRTLKLEMPLHQFP
jgi:hypothetical protein